MAQEPNINESQEIKQHIETERGQLQQSLNELEYRIRRAVDWRAQFDRSPWMFLGTAFGAGLLLGLMTGGRSEPRLMRRCYCEE
jgi:ElaB/YqjD/DUF883 family membrane-anchored ribosome-binding protein